MSTALLVQPLGTFDRISRKELNDSLAAWGHKMGPWNRPSYREWFYGLRHNGELVAVTAAGDLIRERAAGGFTRAEAFELGRVCAVRRDLNRAVLRLWRELVFPAIGQAHGFGWVISYQDAVLHRGDLYRHDGWVLLAYSTSGTDGRSGRKGRRKFVWGWCACPGARAAYAAIPVNRKPVLDPAAELADATDFQQLALV